MVYTTHQSPPCSFALLLQSWRSAHTRLTQGVQLRFFESPRAIPTYEPEECLTIVLTSEIGRGATGVVHRGMLQPEILDGAGLLDVVVKLAFDRDRRADLRNEYEIYRRLRLKGVLQGITTALGFFEYSEGGACALVLQVAVCRCSALHSTGACCRSSDW
jgi:hypothetical protein